MNLVEPFLAQAAAQPERVALIVGPERITYGELARRSAALARRWQTGGLMAGQKALLALELGITLYVALLALFRLGAVAVFPPPGGGLAGLRACARRVAPEAFVGSWSLRLLVPVLPELRNIAYKLPLAAPEGRFDSAALPADAPALLTFTSGSTGRAKGVVRSHGFLRAQHQQLCAVLQPQAGAVELNAFPVFILGNLASGVTSVLPAAHARDPARIDPYLLLAQIECHAVTRLLLPPILCAKLAATGRRCARLSHVFTGGGPVFPQVLRALAVFAPNAAITAVYGSSEAEPIAHISLDAIAPDDFAAMRAGAGLLVGQPGTALQLRLVDDEIWVAGPQVVQGYWDAEDAVGTKVAEAGVIWHRTGDAGRLDTQGRLWLWGRHAARVGGVYPFQVEVAARELPGVRNAAFLNHDGAAVLAWERASAGPVPWPAEWLQRWAVREVARIPLDARHRSKVDYEKLRALLGRRGPGSTAQFGE